jgi:hypothetical protein
MPKMIQIRNVPDHVHSTFKARAARRGMTLSDLLKKELEHIAERLSLEEWYEGVKQIPPAVVPKSPTRIIREMRDAGSRLR